MARNGSPKPDRFDAFVSYSREDESFAEWLEAKLERYRPPKGSGRRMHVFRDISDLIGSTLSEAIVDALGRSKHLIVVCSPSARESAWVNREIEVFAAANGPDNIIPILFKGRPNNETGADDDDQAFPPALAALYDDPLSADYRTREESRSERRARRREAFFFVLARLLDVEKETLIRRQRRRTIRFLGLAIAMLSVLTVAFALISFEAIRQRDDARNQTRIALSRRLAAQAFANLDGQLDLALLLGLQAHKIDPNPDALGSMLAGLGQSPNLITYLRGHTGRVLDLAFDAGSGRLASASFDGTIRIWDTRTGRQSRPVLRGHKGGVRKIYFSPDGGRLVSVGDDKTIRTWKARSFMLESSVSHSHPEGAREVAITPDGQHLALAGQVGISLWNVTEGRPLSPPIRDANPLWAISLAFSPDGKLLAVGNDDYNDMIRVWEVATQSQLEPFVGTTATSLAFSPDGRKLASGVNSIRVWDVETRQQIGRPLVGHGLNVLELVFSADGEYLASVSMDRTLRFWNLKQQRALGQPLSGFGTSALAISTDGGLMAAGGDDGTISLWNTERWDFHLQHRLARLFEHRESIQSLTFSPDGSHLVTGDEDGHLHVWDVSANTSPGKPIPTNEGAIYKQVFHPNGRTLALVQHGFVTLWDFLTGESLGRIGYGNQIMQHIPAVAFSPDGRILATGGMDAAIRLWDVETRQLISPSLRGHTTTVLSLAFSPDGKHLVSASGGGTVRLWDTRTFQALGPPLLTQEGGMVAVFITDDKQLIAVSVRAIHRWRLPDLEALPTLRLNKTLSAVGSSAALRPDGRQLALLHTDGTIQIWDLQSGLPIGEAFPQNEVSMIAIPAWGTLAYSPDGKLLASRGGQNEVRIWNVDAAHWRRKACKIANRNLSLIEWERFLGTPLTYCRTCPELPSGDGAPEDAPPCTEWN